MTKWMRESIRYTALLTLTVMAIGVMMWASRRDDSAATLAKKQVTTEVPIVAQSKPLVAVKRVEASLHEVVSKYTGKIRPWETYSIGFEVGGRLVELGTDKEGNPLDDGSRVVAGQLLGRLDDRILVARRSEASAQREQAATDLRRARNVREAGLGAITEADFQQALTDQALATAQLEIATKNLEDATLTTPVDATISRRLAEPGESVAPNQTVFELVQNDPVLLVVDVPEADIPEIQRRMRSVQVARKKGEQGDPESRLFRARVFLQSRDRYGERMPPIDAEVFRISELADSRTGLFEVEVRVSNSQYLLRPGMVAVAELVVDRISAYRVPETAVLFRGDQTYLFSLATTFEPLTLMFWDIRQVPLETARQVSLTEWIDGGDHLLVPSTSVNLDRIVVRGQQRLSDGQHVRVVGGRSAEPVVARRLGERTAD